MKKRFLNLLTGVALLLAVAVVALWVRSYRACDRLTWASPTAEVELIASRGRAELSRVTGLAPPAGRRPQFSHHTSEPRQVVPGAWDDLADGSIPGVHYARESSAIGVTIQMIALPHYLVAALTLALPVGRAVAGARSSRRIGHCVCGYDIRATPERCPECGKECSRADA